MVRVDSGYAVVYIQIGDVSIYRRSFATNKIVRYGDSTLYSNDMGGRVGLPPNGNYADPDLRNMSINHFLCDVNDSIIVLSDGIDDNFRIKIPNV